MAPCRPWRRATCSAMSRWRGRRGRQRRQALAGGRSSGGAVHDHLRHLFLLSEGAILAVRHLEPERGSRPQGHGSRDSRCIWLFPHDGRIRRRPGRVSPGTVRQCWPAQIPSGLPDEQVLFLSDIFPTGYMAAENCHMEPGDTVAVWGCGPVGQCTIQSAWMLGAGRVIAIDRVSERLRMAEQTSS